MTDSELEAAIDAKWRSFLAAVQTKDCDGAAKSWHELGELHLTRNPEQIARALALAELKADGTCAHPRVDKGVCLKCGATT